MLLKTNAELKKYFSNIDKDYVFDSLLSFIDDAEKDLLIPWIGQEIYDVINAAYNGMDAMAGKKAELLPYLQKAVVHLALMLSADSGSFRISDSGFYVVSTATNKPVSDKKMADFKRGRRESGYRAMEQAVLFLEKNINEADFSTYKTSDAHTNHQAHFINDSVTFTGYYKKVDNSAYLFARMLDSLDYIERNKIRAALGSAYYAAVKGRLLARSLTDAEKSLLPYINRVLANYTIAKALLALSVEFDGTGLIVSSQPVTNAHFDVAEAKMPASNSQIGLLVKDASATGDVELSELEDYLITNAADLEGYIPPAASCEDIDINDPCSPILFV